jgi:hypothetical protein
MRGVVFGIALVTVLAMAAPAGSNTQMITEQPAVEHVAFTFPDVEGWIEYPKSYGRPLSADVADWNGHHPYQSFRVYLKVRHRAPLYCLDYRDFRFDLRNDRGLAIAAANPKALSRAVEPEMFYGMVGAVNTCPYIGVLRADALIDVYCDDLYPNLDPGAYTLNVTLAPKTIPIPETDFPTLSFRVTPSH